MDFPWFDFYPSPDSSSGHTSPQEQTVLQYEPGTSSELQGGTEFPEPLVEEHPTDATVSIAFHPSLRVDDRLPDSIIVSSTHVYFYVHRHRIANVSSNGFDGLFSDGLLFDLGFLPSIPVPESGDIVNVLLHTVYDLSCVHYHPTIDTVADTLAAMSKYGISVPAHAATPATPLFRLLLSHAPYHPIEVYALAAQHHLDVLAVAVSSHLLAYDTARLTDALVEQIGPVYLLRLFLLHAARLAALKAILLQPPAAHPTTPGAACNDTELGALTRAWAFAAAQLVWEATPSISTATLRVHLEPIGESISCESCRLMLLQRIQDVVYSWSMVKTTI